MDEDAESKLREFEERVERYVNLMDPILTEYLNEEFFEENPEGGLDRDSD